jgi:hypothetical protein
MTSPVTKNSWPSAISNHGSLYSTWFMRSAIRIAIGDDSAMRFSSPPMRIPGTKRKTSVAIAPASRYTSHARAFMACVSSRGGTSLST